MPRKRKSKPPNRYEPREVVRSRRTKSKKRARRRNPKFSCQRKLSFPDVDSDGDVIPTLFSDDSDTSSDEDAAYPWQSVENVSFEMCSLMKKAVQAKNDFPQDIKIEMPRYRCLKCKAYFNLETYRKVCALCLCVCVS